MRPFFLVFLFLSLPLVGRGETMGDWLNAAPKADVTFTPWDGDMPSANPEGDAATTLGQSFYGYLDLSRLPAAAFPIRLRLLYDAPLGADIVRARNGGFAQLKDSAPAGSGSVMEEAIFGSPAEVRAVPVWSEPSPAHQQTGYVSLQESLRVEIQSASGAVLGRFPIGVSAVERNRPRAVLVNAPGANQPFLKASYRVVTEVKRLVPDSYAFLGVDTIWIDAATAADPALSDTFWRQVLLGGTTVAGQPGDVGVLAKRLDLVVGEPTLLGGLVAADSPTAFTDAEGPLTEPTGSGVALHGATNPFVFSVVVGEEMHRQLLTFSSYYLGIFVVLQIIVIFGAFLRFRGARRVWLWLVVPGFAIAYTIAGIAVAHLVVRERSEARFTQVELAREDWPQALLLTQLEQISLAERDVILDLPGDSRPYVAMTNYNSSTGSDGTFFFRRNHDSEVVMHPRAATRAGTRVRSFLNFNPPCRMDGDGTLHVIRNFSGAWVWDGANWHYLADHRDFNLKATPIIYPATKFPGRFLVDGSTEDEKDFPSLLAPLLRAETLKAMAVSGQGLFLGIEPVADVHLRSSKSDSVVSRRIVAYQFRLPGGTP